MSLFVFRPGGVQQGHVFANWAALVDAMLAIEGRKMLEFDDSLESPCVIPALPPGRAAWEMSDVSWAGFGPRPSVARPRVEIQEGAVFTGLRMIGGQITIVNEAVTTPPVSDLVAGDHVQIGLRDDAGNTELINQGTAPLFDIRVSGAIFFVQNSVLGVRSQHPLISYAGASPADPRPLFINLLGLNQTGNNVVRTEQGAAVVFAALSPAAQVGIDQTAASDEGVVRFGPVGRIQRQVLPLPPAPPATSALVPDVSRQSFTLPNVILRCSGAAPGFVQPLPRIRGGFTMGVGGLVALYSGGQEVVVAEIAGGPALRVSAADGDTIDGFSGPVGIGAHEARTFISDGAFNWITMVSSRASLGVRPIERITAILETSDEAGAEADGPVFLGFAGREFRCDRVGKPFQRGAADTFIFGLDANVLHPDRNDPRKPQLTFDDVDRFPAYIRFDPPGGQDWKLRRARVRLSLDHPDAALQFQTPDTGAIWLGADAGTVVFLRRQVTAIGVVDPA